MNAEGEFGRRPEFPFLCERRAGRYEEQPKEAAERNNRKEQPKETAERNSWKKQIEGMDMKKIFWAGDSTVQTNDIVTYPQTGIGQAFALYINNEVRIENYAKNGRSTKSFLEEGRLQKIDENISCGDFLFIQFGHNDEKSFDPARYTVPGESFDANLCTFINTARRHGAYPVLITPLERKCFDEQGILGAGEHKPYVQAIRTVGVAEKVPVVDLYAKSRELLKQAGEKKAADWYMNLQPSLYANYLEGKMDNTHLKYEGAVTFAGLIAEELRKMGGIYAEILVNPNKEIEGLEDGDKA